MKETGMICSFVAHTSGVGNVEFLRVDSKSIKDIVGNNSQYTIEIACFLKGETIEGSLVGAKVSKAINGYSIAPGINAGELGVLSSVNIVDNSLFWDNENETIICRSGVLEPMDWEAVLTFNIL